MASNIASGTADAIRSLLQEAEDQGSFRDVYFTCSGVEAESIVQVGDAFFQHVHTDEGNVFDFTDWTLQHPGGAAKIKQFLGYGMALFGSRVRELILFGTSICIATVCHDSCTRNPELHWVLKQFPSYGSKPMQNVRLSRV